jgi:hypothetical protein
MKEVPLNTEADLQPGLGDSIKPHSIASRTGSNVQSRQALARAHQFS